MEFYSKYELIDPLPGGGSRSFRGRQTSTSREVLVHLLPGGASAENQALLARLRSLPARAMAKLIEVGDNEGTTYVVTEAPPYLHLEDWLAAQERAAVEDAAQYTRAGMWKVPTMPPAAPVAPAAPEPGEFTRMFQQNVPPAAEAVPAPPPAPVQTPKPEPEQLSATIEMPTMRRAFLEAREPQAPPAAPAAAPPPVAAAPSPAPAAASAPGEFTRLFQAPGAPAPTGQMAAMPAPPPVVAAPPQAPPPQAVAGEFTRSFQAPATPALTGQMPAMPVPQAAPPPPVAAASPSEPAGAGEFTRMFQSPLPHAPARGEWPAEAPRVSQPGEFTRMFQSGGGNPIPPAPQQEKPAGEFTRFFQAGSGSPQGGVPLASPPSPFSAPMPQAPSSGGPSGPGGFTQMFGKPGAPPPPPPAPAMGPQGGGGSATQAFSIPVQPQAPPPRANVPPPPLVPQGPSEYTRMISLGGAGAPAGPGGEVPPPLAPGQGLGGAPQFQMPAMPQMPIAPQMPQMPAMPQIPQAPQMPQFQMPQAPQMQAPPAKAPSSNTLLIAIFCVLAFIAGLVVMVVLTKK